jgi:aspartyl-tRNA synthetase
MCEFYQVDLEMSFVEQTDVLKVLEQYSKDTAQAMVPHKTIVTDFPHISYHDAMDQYGTDRPDIRFDMKVIDVSEIVRESEFGVFSKTITSGGVVKAIKLDQQELSRKDIDEITEVAKHA